jgi:integrase
MGVLKRRSGIYWINFMADGKQRFESTHLTSKRFAQKLLSIRKAEIAEGRYRLPASKPPFLSDYADQFLETVRHPNTKRAYQSCTTVLKEFFGTARLNQISARRIEEFKQERLKSGTGPATVNRNLAVLRRMLKIAARGLLLARSPFNENGVEFLDERRCRRQPHIVTFEEEGKLLAVASPRLRVLVVLLTETGLRVGKEGLQLKWTDIDFKNSAVHVRQSKTPAGRRVVPLSELCKAELLRWKELCGPEFSEFVFPSFLGTRHPLRGGRKSWIAALKKAGIEYFPIYNLRATFASRLSAAGVPDVFVSQMMGHAGGLLQTYAKAIDEYRREAIHKLESYRESAGKQSNAVEQPPGIIQ